MNNRIIEIKQKIEKLFPDNSEKQITPQDARDAFAELLDYISDVEEIAKEANDRSKHNEKNIKNKEG